MSHPYTLNLIPLLTMALKSILIRFAEYNLWANSRLCGLMRGIDAGLLNKELTSSFPSLLKTLSHIKDVQFIWYNRLKNLHGTTIDKNKMVEPYSQVETELLKYSDQISVFVKNSNELYFETFCEYTNSEGKSFKNQVSDILLHCFNHSTFHRGQIITLLRNINFSPFKSTDFITFCRERPNGS